METRLTIDYDKQWLNCVSAIGPQLTSSGAPPVPLKNDARATYGKSPIAVFVRNVPRTPWVPSPTLRETSLKNENYIACMWDYVIFLFSLPRLGPSRKISK